MGLSKEKHELVSLELENAVSRIESAGLMTNEGPFFASLTPLANNIPFLLSVDVRALCSFAREFSFQLVDGSSVSLDVNCYSSRELPEPNAVVLGQFVSEADDLVAIMASTIFRDKFGRNGSELVVVERDMHRDDMTGFGRAFIRFYNQLNRLFGADYEIVRAQWLGRKVWTRLGDFQFDERYAYSVNGGVLTQGELVQNNFHRFLEFHGVAREELIVHGTDKSIAYVNFAVNANALRPADYLRIHHRTGKKINVEPLIDYQSLGPLTAYDIGEAFILSDNRPYANQQTPVRFVKNGALLPDVESWPPNNSFSDRAMPPWVGVRPIIVEKIAGDVT